MYAVARCNFFNLTLKFDYILREALTRHNIIK